MRRRNHGGYRPNVTASAEQHGKVRRLVGNPVLVELPSHIRRLAPGTEGVLESVNGDNACVRFGHDVKVINVKFVKGTS